MRFETNLTSSSASTRLIGIGRTALPCVIGLAVVTLRARPLELVSASRCPGLLELIGIAAVRSDPDLTAGALFGAMHAVAIAVAVATFVQLVFRRSGDLAVATAAGLALGLSPAFPSTLAPPWEAAAFASCAAAALLSGPLWDRSSRTAWLPVVMFGAVVIATFIVPSWIVPAAIGTALAVFGSSKRSRLARWLLAGAASLSIVCIALAFFSVSPPNVLAGGSTQQALASCVWTGPTAQRTLAIPGTIGWALGPFAIGLCALGLFVETSGATWRRRLVVSAIGLGCIASASVSRVDLPIVLAPGIVGVWWLAASGLREIMSNLNPRHLTRAVGVLLLVLLPALQVARFNADERDDWVRPAGHEQTTLRQVTAGLNSVSPDAVFVEEDASVELLLRAAAFTRRRSLKPFTVGSRETANVSQALRRGAVYAFPTGRKALNLRGFTSAPLDVPIRMPGGGRARVDGISTITGFQQCRTVGSTWVDVASIFADGRIAMVADSEAAYGPLAIFLGASTAVEPRPDGWPPRTTRGFRLGVFEQRTGERSERLAEEARDVGLSGDQPVLAAPFVVQLMLHRTPRAPLALPVTLGGAFPLAAAKLLSEGDGTGRLELCDAPRVEIAPLGQRPD